MDEIQIAGEFFTPSRLHAVSLIFGTQRIILSR